MSSTINLSLTDELRSFINSNCGDGSMYATPSEFLRDILREKKERLEAAELRNGVLEGYRNIMNGDVVEFTGSLSDVLNKAKQ